MVRSVNACIVFDRQDRGKTLQIWDKQAAQSPYPPVQPLPWERQFQ